MLLKDADQMSQVGNFKRVTNLNTQIFKAQDGA